jgi:hypothetical protein
LLGEKVKRGGYFASPVAKCERVLYYRSGGKFPVPGRHGEMNKSGQKEFCILRLIFQKADFRANGI